MEIQNKAMLITYADSLGKNLKDVRKVLKEDIGDAIGGVHLLPFFPSTGDRGLHLLITHVLIQHLVIGVM